jgi:hypothetical protein
MKEELSLQELRLKNCYDRISLIICTWLVTSRNLKLNFVLWDPSAKKIKACLIDLLF